MRTCRVCEGSQGPSLKLYSTRDPSAGRPESLRPSGHPASSQAWGGKSIIEPLPARP